MKKIELRKFGMILVVVLAIVLLVFAVKRSQDIRSNAGLHFGGATTKETK